jgi:hypothetical protein
MTGEVSDRSEDGTPVPLPRGVWEDPSVPAGYRQFRAIGSDGRELVSLRIHSAVSEHFREIGPDPVVELRKWLAAVDLARPKLALV